MRTRSIVVSPALSGTSIKTIAKHELGVSSSLLKKLRQQGGILLNGRPARTIDAAYGGDVLTIRFPQQAILPHPFAVLYEDADILAINKPAGIAVHPPNRFSQIAAISTVLGKGCHLVNRLDKGTSGVLLVAKSSYLHECFRKMLHTPAFQREYLALVEGELFPAFGVIDLPIARHGKILHAVDAGGAYARTQYQTVLAENGRTLLRLMPQTGRTHQLRVHLSHIGHPLVGDWLYGTADIRIARPALHSYKLTFLHPITQKQVIIKAPMPRDIQALFPLF